MKNFDKIIELLEKNNLTEEENNSLNKFLKEDAEAITKKISPRKKR